MSEVAYLPLKPVKVEFDKANKFLKIYIDDIKGLDEINLIELESRFKNSLDICEDVEVKLLNNKVVNIKELLQKHKWFLVYKISKKCNGLKAFLKECEITLEGDKLVFLVPNGIRDIMLERKLDMLVKDILSEEFGCKCDVEFRIKDFYIHFDFDSEIESYLKESEEKGKGSERSQ